MNSITRISIIAFVLFAFVGNIGVRVFTHSCSEDGIFRSYFIENQSHCKDEIVPKSLPSCCQKYAEKSCGVAVKENCCTDEVDVFMVTFDFFSWDKVAVEMTEIHEPWTFGLFQVNSNVFEVQLLTYKEPPPKPSGRYLLTHLCTYRI